MWPMNVKPTVRKCLLAGLHPPLNFFFFNDTATTEIYTLSLHDALPICLVSYTWSKSLDDGSAIRGNAVTGVANGDMYPERSEEHTSELQSPDHLVCRLLLEKKNHNARRCPVPTPGLPITRHESGRLPGA